MGRATEVAGGEAAGPRSGLATGAEPTSADGSTEATATTVAGAGAVVAATAEGKPRGALPTAAIGAAGGRAP